MAVEAAAKPVVFEPDGRPLDARKVDIPRQVYSLALHFKAVDDERCEPEKVGGGVDVKKIFAQVKEAVSVLAVVVIPVVRAGAVPDRPVRSAAVVADRAPF